jgi:hypothetical protein
MTPQQFVSKWKQAELKERSAAQERVKFDSRLTKV